MIEAPDKLFSPDELPPVAPDHPVDEIHQAVLNLHAIAKRLRAQRFEGGALRLDQVSGEHGRRGPAASEPQDSDCMRACRAG